MFSRLMAGVLGALVLSSCATSYQGPYPNYSLTGESRQTEIQRFSMTEGFFNQGGGAFTMGSQRYWIRSLEPVIVDVSPNAWTLTRKAQVWRLVGLVALTGAVGILVSEFTDGDDRFLSRDQSVAYWSLLGLSFGANFTSVHYLNRAAHEYNQDLRSKFTPTVGMNFSF